MIRKIGGSTGDPLRLTRCREGSSVLVPASNPLSLLIRACAKVKRLPGRQAGRSLLCDRARGGALTMVVVAGGLTMAVEKTVLALQGDVADIGTRAGTLHPCP